MKIGIRLKLFLASFAVIAVAAIVADAWLGRTVTRRATETAIEDLAVRARVAAREVSLATFGAEDRAKWDALADDLGRTLDARVSIVRRDGATLGDSELDTAALAQIENQTGRPEIEGALVRGHGEAQLGRDARLGRAAEIVAAAPVTRGGETFAIARVSRPLDGALAAGNEARRVVAIVSLLMLVVAGAVAWVVASRMAGVVASLIDAARRMESGDLDVRTRVWTHDELAVLGDALDRLATHLSATLGDLRAERDLLGRILEGMQEGVLVLDADDRIVLVNGALRGMLLLGSGTGNKMFLEVVRHAELHEMLKRTRETRTVLTGEIDVEGIKPRRLLVHAAVLEGAAGGLLAVFVDVTDLRRLESLRRDFVANVSHELRTPVAAVLSAAETLEMSIAADPARSARFVDIIARNGRRLQNLIEDLLELSRLESKEFRLRKEEVELENVVSVVTGLFRERAESKGVRLLTRLPPKMPVLSTDQRAIEQILVNLVDNAIKYCPAGASITIGVGVAEGDDGVRISVEDTGPGIDEKHLPRLFERFYRVDAGRSRDVGGTGLGLSIVKHLAEALGGSASVTSRVGAGSTFAVALPLPGPVSR